MNTLTPERRQTLVYCFTFISTVLALIIVLATIGLQAYVRWTLNKDFTFLGGFELEALTISTFALMLGMAHAYRSKE